jgi:HDOD domain
MLIQAIDRVTNHSWVPSSAWRRLDDSDHKKFARKKVDLLDDVPVMSATVLGLEMLLHEPCIDLRMASELILSDVGATIQILRLVGTEYEFAAEHPCRMGDCIAGLDAGKWFAAISARTFACDRQHSPTTSLWNHCRLVAQYARLFAESIEGVSPEEAYLVGLLHEIGEIPGVLGWSNGGALSAIEESLPLFVLAAIRGMNDPYSSSPWKIILSAAHELAGAGAEFDSSTLHRLSSIAIAR